MTEGRTFQERLLWLLGREGMSCAELARRSGVHENTVYHLTNATGDPRLSTLRMVREGLGCTWEELLGR